MCGRYTLASPNPAEVRSRFAIGESVPVRQRFNVAPGDDVLAVTTDREGAPRGEQLRWGLVPSWSKDATTGLKMINARVETVTERPAYRACLRALPLPDPGRRLLRVAARRQRSQAAVSHHPGRRRLFAFAGLWSIWHAPDGGKLRTCTILTTAANSAVAPLHDRMPVILAEDTESTWLDAAAKPDQLLEILDSLSPSATALRPVSTAVNDARYDGPECLAEPVADRADRAVLDALGPRAHSLARA